MNTVPGINNAPQAWRVMVGPYNPPTYPEEVFREADRSRCAVLSYYLSSSILSENQNTYPGKVRPLM